MFKQFVTVHVRRKPSHLLLLTGLVLILTSLLIFRQKDPIDIHIHDTYVVTAYTYIFRLFATLLVIIWALYEVTNKFLYSITLTWSHVIITSSTLPLIIAMTYLAVLFNPEPRPYLDFGFWNDSGMIALFNKASVLLFIILLLGQFIYLVNLIAGLFRRLV